MKHTTLPLLFVLPALLFLAAPAAAGPIADGVIYSEFVLPGPVRAYVVQWELDRPEIDLMMGFPFGQRSSQTKEAVSAMAARYNDPPEREVLAAVNAGFFGTGNDLIGSLGSESNYLQWPDLSRSWPALAYLDSGGMMISIRPTITDNQLRFADGSSLGIDLINEDRQSGTLVIYTPHWGPSTTTTAQGTEVLLADVTYPMRPGKEMSGVVTAVHTGSASINNAIPEGGAVLAARDSKGTTLAQKAQVGERVTWRLGLSESMWNNARLVTDGAGWILKDGNANTSNWAGFSDSFKGLQPRTMLACNDTHGFLIVVDGRQTGFSIGMTFDDMATFAKDTLGATHALNLDGGGSSTMVVQGTLENSPSDGSQRAVANSLLLVRAGGSRPKDLVDSFPATGRQLAWDDKFTFNPVEAFSPPAPNGGDGTVMVVMDPSGGIETTRVGERMDGNCVVQADIFCDYRPEVAGDGFERVGIFARDQGQGAFESTFYGGGNCYAMTFDTHDGRIRAGKVVDGVFTDFKEASPFYFGLDLWHTFRIVCRGNTIEYWLNGSLFHSATDSTFAAGRAGIGYHEYFSNDANMLGTRADNFLYQARSVLSPHTDSWMLQ
ncbi:MAG: hypothetical protein PWP23_2279 [Candidatus Sumerlaeota bacterium]|nr:hypothetical protein [Candidatus Sumerlaeota bacterium]